MMRNYYSVLVTRYALLIAIVAALIPSYLIRFTIFHIPTNTLEVCILILFLLGLSSSVIRNQWRQAAKTMPTWLFVSCCLFLGASVLSTIISPQLRTSLGILKGWIIIPMIFGWIVYASSPSAAPATSQASNSEPDSTSQIIAVALITLLVFGLADTIYWKNDLSALHWVLLALAAAPRQLQVTGYRLQVTSGLILSGTIVALIGISQIGTLDRIKSIYDVPNSLALFLAPLVVLATAQAIAARVKLQITNYKLLSAAALIMFLTLLFTKSVMGVVSVIIAVIVGVLVIKKLRFNWSLGIGYWSLIAAICITGALVLHPKIEYLNRPGSSAYVRLQLWSISVDLIKEHPMLGIGLGQFEPAYQQKLHGRFQEFENCKGNFGHCEIGHSFDIGNWSLDIPTQPLAEWVYRDPHNWILAFWLNTGILGLASFATISSWGIYTALRSSNTRAKY